MIATQELPGAESAPLDVPEESASPVTGGGRTVAASLDQLREEFESRGVKRVKLGGFDIDGVLRGKYVALDKFWSAAQSGMGFCDVIFGWDLGDQLYDNATVTGWHSGYPDTLARIDLSSFRIIPWEPGTAAFLLDFCRPDGRPLPVSPRQLLQKVESRAAALGFTAKFSSEYEFFLFKESPQSLREKGFGGLETLTPGMFGYSWLRTSAHASLVHELLDQLSAFDIDVEGFHTETGPGVYEAAVRYDTLARAADKAALFKTATKEICARHGLTACFMAKWNAELPGCSGHIHQSLWRDGKSVFHDPTKPHSMSDEMRWYVGGQVALLPELLALIAPTINSYKRLVPGTWAPTFSTWGVENRTTAIRVIPGSESATRVEFRIAAADMNAYIAMATSLAAGLWGIENRVEPPAPVEGNAYAAKGLAPLPRNLGEATERLKQSKLARELLGEEFVDHYVRTREWEVRAFEKAVTRWELERYMELI